MAKAARTWLVAAPAAAVVAAVWLRVEEPRDELTQTVAIVALALAAAAVRPLAARVLAIVLAAAFGTRLAYGLSPLDARPFDAHHDFFGPLVSRFGSGVADFYDVHLPFDPRLHADMRSVVLTAVFAFTLLVALAVDARRPVAATLALLVGAGWPATLLGPSHALVAGGAILLAALVVLAGVAARPAPRASLVAAGALAVAALAASSTSAVAKHRLVDWQRWDPYARAAPAVSVSYVWDAQYGGIRFPKTTTTVLEVEAPPTASLYWRAAVLDDFEDNRWQVGTPRPADALEPAAARERRHQTKQVVTVKALADTRLVGGSEPIRFDAGGAPISQPVQGLAFLPSGLARNFRYTVWSYAPQPSAAALRRSPARYPALLARDGLLDVWPGVTMPAFGARGRAAKAQAALATLAGSESYGPFASLAQRVAGGAPTPYDAAVALERWFRSTGGFRYSNRVTVRTPAPLVDFVTQTRTGYCQYFAGAMALMLRYLGVPARVAVGFSSGTYDDARGVWVVSDHDAHAWVEAWFAGYGWLPFDPTPSAGRPEQGVLSAAYSASSPGFGAAGRADAGGTPVPGTQSSHRHGGATGAAGTTGAARTSSHGTRDTLLVLLALVLGGTVGAIALAKLAVRTARRLTRDPRRSAGACRRELAAFLVDQRIDAAGSATLHELGELLRFELAVDASRFVSAAGAARFGRVEGAPAAARDARRELRALLRQVRARLGVRERLRGLLSLRSLGLARGPATVDGSA